MGVRGPAATTTGSAAVTRPTSIAQRARIRPCPGRGEALLGMGEHSHIITARRLANINGQVSCGIPNWATG